MELSGFVHSASQAAAGAAIASAWQGLLLAAVLWICLKLAPRLSAGTRFAVWSASFVAILLLPFFSFARGLGPAATGSLPAGANHPVVHLDSRWALAIVAAWALLSIARAVVLAQSAFRARALWKSSKGVDVDDSQRTLLEHAGDHRAVRVYSSSAVDQPCVIGFFKPRILVPEWLLATATPAEMRQIVLHEASHLHRWDDWTNLLQKLALAMFPLNPALWWVERQLCSEREEACDERVVRETRSPREYAVCLTNLAAERMERRLRQHSAALSLGAWEHRSALAGRIHSILRSGSQLNPVKARAIMAALVLATAAGAVRLGNSSQLVAFTNAKTSAKEFAGHAQPEMLPANAYHDVVFREPVAVHYAASPKVIAASSRLPLSSSVKPGSPAARKTSLHSGGPVVRRASFSTDEGPSWIVITRWQTGDESLPGRQAPVMVIQSVVRFSASSADANPADGVSVVQTQTGWFVFQL
jgi:beta-lactamase regulating signal transducer with metallopeptidase domain